MRIAIVVCAGVLAAACSSASVPPDGMDTSVLDADAARATDAVADARPDAPACTETVPIDSLYPRFVYLVPGATATMALRLGRDRFNCGADYAITSDTPSVVTAPPTVHLDAGHGYVEFTITAGSVGTTVLHIEQVQPPPIASAQAQASISVLSNTLPACPAGTSITANLAPGSSVSGQPGSALAAASISIPATATTATPFNVTIACAPDQVPTGYHAIGPAVAFAPGLQRFPREMPIAIPINAAFVPSMYELQTEVSYSGPGISPPRIVGMADTRFSLDGQSLTFEAPRLGTYQAVVRQGLGTQHVTRHFTYHAIIGVSMGGLGSSMIAMEHPDLFDVVAPMGGPADWEWIQGYFGSYIFGGFCTAAQRSAGTMDCSMATNARTPPLNDYWEVQQNFEWFNYPDGYGGQGGTFNRASYSTIIRDLTHMFGNPLMPTDPTNGILPTGVPPSQLTETDAARCATPVTLQHYYDDEYNPDGSLPVITFCDGFNVPGHAGEFLPGQGNIPFEAALAVDLNNNGIRDPGEPVIRDATEPFQDVGTDGLADANELGYDPVNNPDPDGDDYERQYNPGGTEGNYVYDSGEPFSDVGLDGVPNTPQWGTGGYDVGESNGRFDTSPGIARFVAVSARAGYAALSQSDAHRLAVWTDGGTRDLLNFGADANNFAGVISQRGESLHVFNNFSPLITGVPVNPASDDPTQGAPGYTFTEVDFPHLPAHSMLRYGFWDATQADIVAGDGGHVGTTAQFLDRISSSIAWTLSRWPGLDHTAGSDPLIEDDAGRCANGNVCTFDFTSPTTNHTASVSMNLPPGYHMNPT